MNTNCILGWLMLGIPVGAFIIAALGFAYKEARFKGLLIVVGVFSLFVASVLYMAYAAALIEDCAK